LSTSKTAVVGLDYVGLPLAVALARHGPVTGYDRDPERIRELRARHDRTGEIDADALAATTLELTADGPSLAGHDIYIITVPTPVDAHNVPDLTAVCSACRTIGGAMSAGAVVVLESTVYPGVTEEVVGPALAAASGLRCGVDFFLGYSPERINPGDRQHTIDRLTKVVAGQTEAVTERLAAMYRRITGGQVFIARDIRTAEAAKAIENAQRDINIAFVNEVAMICQRLGLSAYDVLDAARTKWNFLDFRPGLVGGHCIGVDPFYLANKARAVGHEPHIILAGRAVNDAMPSFIVDRLAAQLTPGASILMLGLTFKENIPDLRNSKAAELALELRRTLYGLPMGFGTNHIHVWRSLLEQAGFTLEDIPKHWQAFWSFWCDEVQPAMRKATGRDDVYGVGLAMSVSDDTSVEFEQFIQAYQANYVTRDGKLVIDDPDIRRRLIRAMDAYTAVYHKGCTPPEAVGWNNRGNNEAFLAAAIVMTPNFTLTIPNALKPERPEDYYKNTVTMAWPDGVDGHPLAIHTDSFAATLFKAGGRVPLAKEFVRFLVAEGWLAHYLDFSGERMLPSMPKLLDQPFWLDPSERHHMASAIQFLTHPRTYNYWIVTGDPRHLLVRRERVWPEAVQRVAAEGITPEQAVDEAIARIKQILAE
jgi:UDP-N-acetyl-D-glucosamine/UDP-N-acetyl-D-galactosamine dehydrogenase